MFHDPISQILDGDFMTRKLNLVNTRKAVKPEPRDLKRKPVEIFCDGAGARPDGKGSGYAWVRTDNGHKDIKWIDGLTNNQAEYRAILSAVESLPKGTCAKIFSDSENTCCQLNGKRRVLDPALRVLHQQICGAIKNQNLTVTFMWVPRRENRAGKMI